MEQSPAAGEELSTIPVPQIKVPVPNPAPPEKVAQIDEIVVTAQRREESIQDAAIAVDVVSGADMSENGITDLTQLNKRMPALISNGESTFIRGVGTFSILSYTDPAVAFSYDGVYIGRPWATKGLMFDLSRVEVLKGPQGTLYGRNATGGAINVLPEPPDIGASDWSGQTSVAIGNNENYNVEAGLTIPVGDESAIRASGLFLKGGATLNDGTGQSYLQSGRIQYATRFGDGLKIRIAADTLHLGGNGQGSTYLSWFEYNQATGGFDVTPSNFSNDEGIFSEVSQAFRTTIPAGPAGRNFDPVTTQPKNDDYFSGVNATITWEQDWGTLTVLPAYRRSTRDQIVVHIFPIGGKEAGTQLSLEPRLDIEGLGIFDITLGAYLYREEIDSDVVLNQSFAYAHQFFSSLTDSQALFGRVTANLTDRFRLVGGLRYSKDSKSIDGATDGLALVCVTAVLGVPFCPTAELFVYVGTPEEQPFDVPERGAPPALQPMQGTLLIRQYSETKEALDQGKLTYRAALEFDLADDVLLYGSVETGFRSGGFSIAAGYETYDPESLIANTIGLKSRLFEGIAQLNVELFDWTYTDQQVGRGGPDDNGNVAFLIQNVGESKIRGFELDFKSLLSETTKAGISVQYLDTAYKSFAYFARSIDTIPVLPTENSPPDRFGCPTVRRSDGSGQDVDCSGYPAFNSPEWTYNLFISQDIYIGDGHLTLTMDSQYRSEYFVGAGYLPEQTQDSMWVSNASLSFEHFRMVGVTLSAYVRNIEDNQAKLIVNAIGGINQAVFSDPRTYGIRLAYRF